MKIELLTDIYSNAQGFKLEGAGIHDVDPARAKYLLATFPDWFQPVDQDAQEPEATQEAPEAESGDAQDEPVAETAEADAEAQEDVSEPEAGADEADQADSQTEAEPSESAEKSDEPEDAQEASEPTAPTKPLSKMNKDELQALAAQIGANVNPEMTADSMRAAIKETQEAA